MIEFNTEKYFGRMHGSDVDILSSGGDKLFTITPGSKIYSYIDRCLRERYDDDLIDAEIDSEIKRLSEVRTDTAHLQN